MIECKCLRCGYGWEPNVAHPRKCANSKCKSLKWNIKPKTKIRFNLLPLVDNRCSINISKDSIKNTKRKLSLEYGAATIITNKLLDNDFEIIPSSE